MEHNTKEYYKKRSDLLLALVTSLSPLAANSEALSNREKGKQWFQVSACRHAIDTLHKSPGLSLEEAVREGARLAQIETDHIHQKMKGGLH